MPPIEPSPPQPGPTSPGAFLQKLRVRPGEAFLAVRALALSLGPDVVERVENVAVHYLRRDRPFASVESSKSRVLLVFPADIPLPDPMGRLLRRGEQRYVPMDGPEALDGHVQEFVRRAYAAAR